MTEIRRIDQMLPSFGTYDAIGTDVLWIQSLLRARGFLSEIFTDQGFQPEHHKRAKDYRPFYSHPQNLLLYHFSIGSPLVYEWMGSHSKVITRYHNITPARYFEGPYYRQAYADCSLGQRQKPLIRHLSTLQASVSAYNAQEFDPAATLPGVIIPVLRHYDALSQGIPDLKLHTILKKHPVQNLLFTGRVVPHKGHHDLMWILHQAQRYIHKNLRLICVGGYDPYYMRHTLIPLAQRWGLRLQVDPRTEADFLADIVFTGAVPQGALVAYYQNAHVFLCLSRHEGFCVPLIEAMGFGVPVLAHTCAAIAETAGQGACLVDVDRPDELLRHLKRLLTDRNVRHHWRDQGLLRARAFAWSCLEEKFDQGLNLWLTAVSRA